MAVYDVQCNALTGGASGALDYIDGNSVDDGSKALVQTNGVAYLYRLNASSGAAESSPDVISPDSNAGNKRWILQGIYLATAQLANGTSINEFSTDGTLAGDSDNAVPTEKAVKTYVDNVGGITVGTFAGYVERPMFEYKDTDEIYINPGRYHHDGTTEQMLYWDSKLTFQFGPGGSNAGSSALAADTWYYLYADDSAIVTAGTNVLTASEFVAVTTAPAYSVSKHGQYNGSDRLVGIFRTNASSQIIEFTHSGGERVAFSSAFTDRSSANITTSFVTVALTGPAISGIDLDVSMNVIADASVGLGYYRAYGTSGDGIPCFDGNNQTFNIDNTINTFRASTGLNGTDPSIDVKASSAGANLVIYTSGYYFPRGM